MSHAAPYQVQSSPHCHHTALKEVNARARAQVWHGISVSKRCCIGHPVGDRCGGAALLKAGGPPALRGDVRGARRAAAGAAATQHSALPRVVAIRCRYSRRLPAGRGDRGLQGALAVMRSSVECVQSHMPHGAAGSLLRCIAQLWPLQIRLVQQGHGPLTMETDPRMQRPAQLPFLGCQPGCCPSGRISCAASLQPQFP